MILTLKNDHLPWMFHIEIQKNFWRRPRLRICVAGKWMSLCSNSREQLDGLEGFFFPSPIKQMSDNFTRKNFSDFIVVFAAQNFAPNWVVLRVSWTVKKRTMDERRGDIFSCCFRETAALQRTKHGSGFCITAGYKIR